MKNKTSLQLQFSCVFSTGMGAGGFWKAINITSQRNNNLPGVSGTSEVYS